MEVERYVDEQHLFGSRGWKGLEWHCGNLLAGVNPDGGHTLEVGAGDGVLGLWLLRHGARSVTLLEPEADGATDGIAARAAAHRNQLGLGDDRWIFRADTFQKFEPDRNYRLILSQNSVNHLDEEACIHLLEDPAARATYRGIFQKIAGALEPGGHLVIADCARTNYPAILLGGKCPMAPQIEWHKHQDPETWAALLEESGLVVEDVRWWIPYYRVRALDAIWRWRPANCATMSYFVLRARRP